MTRKQLVRKIASLLEPRIFKIKIGSGEYIQITAEWCSYIHPEITEVTPTWWEELIYAENLPANGLFTLDLSKFKKFDDEVMSACKESDRQAKEAGINSDEYFDEILKKAEALNVADC